MKTVLITGAASGIGLECAKQISQLGHTVISFDLKECPLKEVASYIVDVSKASSIKKAIAGIADIDVLISSSGVYDEAPIDKVLNSNVDAVVDVNLKGNLLILQSVLPMLRESHGNAVVVGCVKGINADPNSPVYSASKAGLNMLVKCLANTEQKNAVRINGVLPGLSTTAFSIAQSVLYLTGLSSLDANFVNGALLSVDGGESVSSALISESKPNKN